MFGHLLQRGFLRPGSRIHDLTRYCLDFVGCVAFRGIW
jgi:hypothetical protein